MGWSKGMPEDEWQDQKRRNSQASTEGRAVYVRGIPPDWTADQLQGFFSLHGDVEGVNLLPPRQKQPARAAFVNFATEAEAKDAAQVSDNTEVEDISGKTFRLSCSLKQAMGKKVDYVSGFSDLSKARQEDRSLYISGLPPAYGEEEVRVLVEMHGIVENIRMLPHGAEVEASCFVIVSNSEEVVSAIEGLDKQEIEGHVISCDRPKQPKRTREPEEEALQDGREPKERRLSMPFGLPPVPPVMGATPAPPAPPPRAMPPPKATPPPPKAYSNPFVPAPALAGRPTARGAGAAPSVEIRGFPYEASPEEISASIQAGGRSVQAVQITPEGPGCTVVKVVLNSLVDAQAVVEELNGFEFMPGFLLFVKISGGAHNEAPAHPSYPPPPRGLVAAR